MTAAEVVSGTGRATTTTAAVVGAGTAEIDTIDVAVGAIETITLDDVSAGADTDRDAALSGSSVVDGLATADEDAATRDRVHDADTTQISAIAPMIGQRRINISQVGSGRRCTRFKIH